MHERFALQFGDITAMNVEAIVNSTDETLLAGGPVHRAVHQAAGPGLAEECSQMGGCAVGEVAVSGAHGLGARCVLHTVAPTWLGGSHGEEAALRACYRNAMEAAAAKGIRTLAFPSIGAGVQPQFPLETAAPIAISEILAWVDSHPLPEKVTLVCIEPTTYRAYQQALREILP